MDKTIITIREMNASDAWQVAEIEQSVFSEPWKEQDFIKATENGNYIYLVACNGEAVVGYAGCVIACDDADITNIAVQGRFRRMGIADKLLEVLERVAGERAVKNVFLEVRESNDGARSLYTSRGYVDIGMRKNFYREPDEDAVLMQKIIKKEDE